jgi:hypothetical protein
MWTKYVPEIINELNQLQQLPKQGLLAGGAIANKIWEKVTGKSIPVNDIDIFVYGGFIESSSLDKDRYKKYTWIEKEKARKIDTYSGIKYESSHNKFYRIEEHSRDGLLNTVTYTSNICDPNLIIESFDINCTQVGYDLETGELFYSKHFDEFIKTSELKVVCANTPSHTLVRILKKRDELGAKLNKKIEFKYLTIARKQGFENYIRHYFGEKYMNMIKFEWIEELAEYNIILQSVDTDEWKDAGWKGETNGKLWTFNTVDRTRNQDLLSEILLTSGYTGVRHLHSLNDLDFYIRNVFDSPVRERMWDKFGHMWSRDKEYLTSTTSDSDIELLNKYYTNIQQIEITLEGLNFNEQILVIKKLEELTDTETTNGILRVCKISNADISDDDVLLMSLKARKIIHEQRKYAKQDEYFTF